MFKTIKTADDLAAEAEAQALEKARSESLAYLASTDWMVTRKAETGKAIPDDVTEKRAKARAVLNA